MAKQQKSSLLNVSKGVSMISKRASGFTSFIVMDVMAKAEELERKGEHVIHLEVGEPDFPTPKVITDTAIAALQNDKTRYTHALGLLELRQAVCDHYLKEYGVTISPQQLMISTGTFPVLLFAMLAMIDHRDEVIVSNPTTLLPEFHSCRGRENQRDSNIPGRGFQYRHKDIQKS